MQQYTVKNTRPYVTLTFCRAIPKNATESSYKQVFLQIFEKIKNVFL